MATKTYGTTSSGYEPYLTSSNKALVNAFTPDDWGGNQNPQEGRALYVVTRMTAYGGSYAVANPPREINLIMGSSVGATNKASSRGYKTSDGSSSLTVSKDFFAANVSAVLGSNSTYYGGVEALSSAGFRSKRSTSDSGSTLYSVTMSTKQITYTYSSSHMYLKLDYYGLPNSPTSLTANASGTSSVSLSWQAPSTSSIATAADKYKVQYKESSSSSWLDFTTTTSTSATVSGLSSGTSYNFRVAGVDNTIQQVVSNATGPWSSTATATTESAVAPPTWSGSFNSWQEDQSGYSDSVRASGHDTAYGNISITSGSLPPGLNGNGSGEYFSVTGTPTVAGTYPFTLQARNDGGTVTQNYSIFISSLPAPSWTDQTIDTTATVGESYSDQVSASNVDTWSLSGTLPPGINFSNGVFSGTPTTVGSYSFTVFASNTSGSAQKSFTIEVASSILGGGSRMTGDSSSTPLTIYRRYDGNQWIELTIAKRFNGSSWEDI